MDKNQTASGDFVFWDELKPGYRSKTIYGRTYYRGFVKVPNGLNIDYSMNCSDEQVTKNDALRDAKRLIKEIDTNHEWQNIIRMQIAFTECRNNEIMANND